MLLLEGPNRSDLDIQRGCGHRDGSSDACLSHGLGGGLLVAAHDAGDDALELHGPGAAAVLALIRFDKLVRLIEQCRYGIHDLSRTTPDSVNRLPRFNMPLELGLFLGARRFGTANQKRKVCMILERDRHRYQKFCSDIAGQDVRAHNEKVEDAIKTVRNWLQTAKAGVQIPGHKAMEKRHLQFRKSLPAMCKSAKLTIPSLTFTDYRMLVVAWLQQNP